MRKCTVPVSPLFSGTVEAILAATLLHPRHQWYLSDLALHLRLRPSSLQHALAQLTGAGVLTRRRDGNRVYYRPDESCPILPELTSILTKTTGFAEPLRMALHPLVAGIRVAFIHGSMAQGRQRSESDIDLIIIGGVIGRDLTAALFPLQDRLGRSVSFSRYTAREFKAKANEGHHFVTSVLKKPRIFLIGDENELKAIIGGKAHRPRAHQQTGD